MSATQAAPDAGPTDLWVRWGWLTGPVWLVFMVFPVLDLVRTPRSSAGVLVASTVLVVFSAVYAFGFFADARPAATSWLPRRWVESSTLVLLVLTAAGVWLQGTYAMGLCIYTSAFALLLAPLRLAAPVAVGLVGATAWLTTVVDSFSGGLFFLPVMLATVVTFTTTRLMEERRLVDQEVADELTLVAERERVARDVHDVLGHSLTVVVAKAELAERLLDLDPERARAELAEIRSLSREALSEVRATVAGLRVTRLGDELAAARAALTAAGIDAVVPSDPAVVDPRRRLVLAWVLREAVTNVVRHSGADRCVVELGHARLRVADDGRGRVRGAGNGLRGVEERVRAAGGTLLVDDAPGGGTLLEVTWS